MRIVYAAIMAFVLGTIVGYFCLGSDWVFLITLGAVTLTVPPMAILAGWAILSRLRTGESEPVAISGMIYLALPAAILVTACISGAAFHNFHVVQAETFLASHRGVLEDYRKEHGRYPGSLEEAFGNIRLPKLLRDPDTTYTPEAAEFTISIPTQWYTFKVYNSREGVWTEDAV